PKACNPSLQISQSEEVSLRLGHLLAFDEQMFGMQPVAYERLAGCAFALRDFVFMVWKCQVDPASMDIQSLAEIFHGHRGTLDVPSGTPAADRGLPEVLSRFRRFPQRKIPRALFFVTIAIDARSRLDAG